MRKKERSRALFLVTIYFLVPATQANALSADSKNVLITIICSVLFILTKYILTQSVYYSIHDSLEHAFTVECQCRLVWRDREIRQDRKLKTFLSGPRQLGVRPFPIQSASKMRTTFVIQFVDSVHRP